MLNKIKSILRARISQGALTLYSNTMLSYCQLTASMTIFLFSATALFISLCETINFICLMCQQIVHVPSLVVLYPLLYLGLVPPLNNAIVNTTEWHHRHSCLPHQWPWKLPNKHFDSIMVMCHHLQYWVNDDIRIIRFDSQGGWSWTENVCRISSL